MFCLVPVAAYVVARPRISRQFDQIALDTFGVAAIDQMYQITGAIPFRCLLGLPSCLLALPSHSEPGLARDVVV